MQEVVATREATVVEVEASPGLMLGDRGTGWARQQLVGTWTTVVFRCENRIVKMCVTPMYLYV